MAIVGSFSSRPYAEMAASMLVARGIDARVLGDDAGGAAPHLTMASGGGYAISVREEDRDAAEELLDGAADRSRPLTHPRTLVLRAVLWTAVAVFVALLVVDLLAPSLL